MEIIFLAAGFWALALILLLGFPSILRWWRESAKKAEKQQTYLWWPAGEGSPGYEQVGRQVEIEGRTGKVISGTELTITVEWDR